MGKKTLLLLSAALAGASGMGLEVILLDLAGLTLGYGVSAFVGIVLFLSGWSLGAWWAGARVNSPAACLLVVGVLLAVVGSAAPLLLVGLAQLGHGATALWIGTALLVLASAIPQGCFLPLLARGWSLKGRADLGAFFAANLVGAAGGALLLGSFVPQLYGRGSAGVLAGATALGAALFGAALLRAPQSAQSKVGAAVLEVAQREAFLSLTQAGALLAFMTAWVTSLEWLGLRLAALWLGGMHEALGSVLVASLIALSAGAFVLPRVLPNSRWGLALLVALSCAGTFSFTFLPELLGNGRDGAMLLRAFHLIGFALFSFGAWVPMLHRALAGESSARLGRLLGFEALGALIGLPLVHYVVFALGGTLGVLASFAFGAAVLLVLLVPKHRLALGALLLVLTVGASRLDVTAPALEAPPLAQPAFEILEFTEDEHFAVTVVQDGLLGERTLMTDGFRAAASGRDYAYMRALAHLPLLLHNEPRSVGVLAFGTGTTAGAVSLHSEVQEIEVLELSSAVIAQAQHFEEVNRGVLKDPRVRVALGDGRHTLAQRACAYDVLTMEPLLPDSPFGVYLYTQEFYARARTALKPGGLLCQWVPPHALEPASFEAVVGAFTSAFEWSSVWVFGTQVILLGGERAPTPLATRFPTDGGELQSALAGLGLERLEGVLGRFVLSGAAWPVPARALTDLDPWISYRPRRRGSVLLADLPLNLASLRERAEEFPVEWRVGFDPEQGRIEALALLREAREVRAASDASARIQSEAAAPGGWLDQNSGQRLLDDLVARVSKRSMDSLLAEASRLAPNEAGLIHFESQLEFEDGLRRGLNALLSGGSEAAAGDAATALLRAVRLRPERADAHAYLSVALSRLQSDRAALELAQALKLCPRLHETSAGQWLERLAPQEGAPTPTRSSAH